MRRSLAIMLNSSRSAKGLRGAAVLVCMKQASERPTEPVVSTGESYESYCAALGVDATALRGASVVRALHAYLGAGKSKESKKSG